jgi:hypothetical protein
MTDKPYRIKELTGFDAMNAMSQYLTMIYQATHSPWATQLIIDDVQDGGKLYDSTSLEKLKEIIKRFRALKNDDGLKLAIFVDLIGLCDREVAEYKYLYLNVCTDKNGVPISRENEDNYGAEQLLVMAYEVFCQLCSESGEVFF